MKRDGQIARRRLKTALLGGAAAILMAGAAMAQDASIRFDIAAQDAGSALNDFSRQSGVRVLFPYDAVAGKQVQALRGDMTVQQALDVLTRATGLQVAQNDGQTVTLTAPQSGSAAGDGADGTVQALIVTAQKREENIQDVPIAMSAFTQEDLTRSQVAGGPDLITQVPNMTFTKTNFTSYSIQIRGIGTQAISATTDAAVAVALNNSSMIRNNFFEQEFYDLQRVEVLRGPQGTLYGRNATAGVVNIITAKPKFTYEAHLSADVANYKSTRLEGMVNIPLVEDKVALRIAGARTRRDGFDTNQITGNQIDGRDLWSTRVSLRFEPTDAIGANLIWEHFQEDDDRLRSGKQLCKRDDRTELDGVTRSADQNGAVFNQSCVAASLYGPESFQAPDGFSLPYYHPLGGVFLPDVPGLDPYLSTTQSRDLRVIESTVNPEYRAKSDVGELQLSFDLGDNLTLTSETAYSANTLFSLEDYNRFNTRPGVWNQEYWDFLQHDFNGGLDWRPGVLENGVFCDPQLGCSDRLVAVDLSTAKSRQFSQEFRISSDYDGPFNFSLGVNFLRYDTEDKYYVFINSLSLYSLIGNWNAVFPGGGFPEYVPGVSDNKECLTNGPIMPDINKGQGVTGCIYMDPNPIYSLNDQGHNYFLSRNPYKLISYAAFGEAYYDITPELKLTAGLRFTVDKKEAPRIPSWLLAAETLGYPVAETVSQEWREPTGRVAFDWKPDLGFTDDTLLYASYAHGYKAGGANPPAAGVITYGDNIGGVVSGLIAQSATSPKIFKPEFVDAFEVGTKNTLLDGRLTLNLDAFYYDYKGYQISYIVSRSAVNLNFDAKIWGLELEADWQPIENLRIGLKGGYEQTRVADGMRAVDVMDRTAGHEDWMVVRPFPSYPNNCILPVYTAAGNDGFGGSGLGLPPNSYQNGNPGPCEFAWLLGRDPLTQLGYVKDPVEGNGFPVQLYFPGYIGFNPLAHPEVNNGEGFYKDLSGRELPNAPKFTGTLTVDYTLPLTSDWLMALHGDLHYQGESWARIFNTEGYDKLKAYTNLNLAAIFTNEDAGWKVMAYVKNVLDSDSITGAFLNSDDSGLTTNVFLTEPRLYGLRVTKDWVGAGSFFGMGDGRPHTPGAPYLFQVEVGATMSRFDSGAQPYTPNWITPVLSPSPAVQDNDLDWGDVRDLKLTYAPVNGWRISAAYRVGKTNMSDRGAAYEDIAPGVVGSNPAAIFDRDNRAITTLHDSEEYAVADFIVGKEIGLGAFGEGGKSAVSAGMRYANFKSTAHLEMEGITDSYISPTLGLKYGLQHYEKFANSFDSTRDFEGAGPALSWGASARLWGDDEGGHADVDWSVGGAVLYGTRSNDSSEDRWGQYTHIVGTGFLQPTRTTLYDQSDVARHRSEHATVPNLSLGLGLSYSIDRVKVSTGYSWDRYFDAIDGGGDTAKSYDRTINGPYFKIAVGFGG